MTFTIELQGRHSAMPAEIQSLDLVVNLASLGDTSGYRSSTLGGNVPICVLAKIV